MNFRRLDKETEREGTYIPREEEQFKMDGKQRLPVECHRLQMRTCRLTTCVCSPDYCDLKKHIPPAVADQWPDEWLLRYGIQTRHPPGSPHSC